MKPFRFAACLLALLFVFASVAQATEITLNSFQIKDWRYAGSTLKLRLYSSDTWTDSLGYVRGAGVAGSQTGFYKEIICTVAATTATCPTTIIPSTLDSLDRPQVRITGSLFDERNSFKGNLFQNWIIPASPTTTTWADLVLYNRAQPRPLADIYYTAPQVDAKIQLAVGAVSQPPNASSSVAGVTKLSVNPVSSSNPIARAVNDPLDRDADKLQGRDIAPTAPTDQQTLLWNEAANRWQPGVGGGGGGGGDVTSVFGRTGAIFALDDDYTWAQIDKTVSSIADITTRSASDLSSGTLPAARMPALTGDITTSAGTVATAIASQDSAFWRGKVSDETGTGAWVFGTAPTFTTSITSPSILASSNLQIQPTGNLELDAGGKQIDPVLGYDQNLGQITKKYLTLHAAELWVQTLVAVDTVTAVSGRVLVPKNSTSLIADLTTGSSTIDVKHNAIQNGHRVLLEADGKFEAMAITSGATVISGGFRYSVTRNLDGSGANLWYAGDAVLNTGTTGDGFIDIYSSGGLKSPTQVGPTIAGNVRNSATYNDWSEHWAVGNLNGLYGYSTTTFGAAFGKYAAGAAHVTIDATNGYRIFNGQSTVIGQWDNSGVITIGQAAAGQSNVRISSGVLALRNNTTERIRLNTDGSGFLANSLVAWDTSGNLTVTGNATIAGWTVNNTSLARDTGTNSTSAGMAPADFPFFAGAIVANRATAPFRVTPAGALTATNATVTGSITAQSGNIAGWAITSNALTNNEVKIAAGVNWSLVAGTGEAWFGKGSTGYYGILLKGTSADFINLVAGHPNIGTAGRPFLQVNDGSRARIVLGELNTTTWDGTASNSIGMKIWNSAGTKLVEFSDIQNTIGGWSIGPDYIRDAANSVGMASTVSGGDDVRFWAGDTFTNRATSPFRVTEAGALTATNATITGAITATSGSFTGSITSTTGTIGGWTIGASSLSATNVTLTSGAANTANILVGTGANAGGLNSANASGDIAIWAGSTHANRATAAFRVTAGGALTATNATITGAITASSGSITGPMTMSGASSSISIGTTPPTSPSAGTGVWIDRTGFYGLASSVLQAKLDAATGAITAGAGAVKLDSAGFSIVSGSKTNPRTMKLYGTDGTTLIGSLYATDTGATDTATLETEDTGAATIRTKIVSTSFAGAAKVLLETNRGGVLRDYIDITAQAGITMSGAGVIIGAASGGAMGDGTINVATDIFKNGGTYTNPDYIFEEWATGDIEKFADKEGAQEYRGLMPLNDLRGFVETNYHLPRFGQQAGLGLFSGGDALLATVEELHLYIFQLEDRIKKLEAARQR